MNKFIIIVFLWIACFDYTVCQQDQEMLLMHDFVKSVVNQHPKSAQANLLIEMAQAKLLETKGKFDPILKSDLGEKSFSDKLYYHKYQTELVIPTAIGLDLVTGYQKNYGNYLNPEATTDRSGLWNFTLELDVLQGLIRNERRIAMDQAKVHREMAFNEKDLALNDLIFEACFTYLQWQMIFFYNNILKENTDIAKIYYNITKETYLGGEKTALDTLESFIAFKDAELLLQKNTMELTKMQYAMKNFLWYEGTPLEQKEEIILPENVDSSEKLLSNILSNDIAMLDNPILKVYENKLKILELDMRLKREKLKPKLKLKYNSLLSTEEGVFSPTFASKDYVYGFSFSMPLFLRSERGALSTSKLKMEETNLTLMDKNNQIKNSIENYKVQLEYIKSQIALLTSNINSYKVLMDSERIKFELGESSVFLLNKRQDKYIEARLKLITEWFKLQTIQLNYLYYTNTLSKLIN
ncbi:MAG: TolC family protein [Saprospiraceae bacterium]